MRPLTEPYTATPPGGLGSGEAASRLAAEGPNALPDSVPRPVLRIVLDILREPMFTMLVAAGAIYLLLGDPAEAAFLLVAVFAVMGLALAQERKTQRALEALRDLSAPRALVIRDGAQLRIASREVVRGDLLVLREGDRIAADGILVSGQIACDESLLTGESVACEKLPGGGDPAAAVLASTLVTRGNGVAQVHATGVATHVGRIGVSLASTGEQPSPLQVASRRVVRALAAGGLSLAMVLFAVAWLWDGRAVLESLLLGIAFAMAVMPEEVPLVLTVFLAMGAWRLSRRQVLTRRLHAIEALGGITVLGVDKTGTLTLNRMEVRELRNASGASFSDVADAALPWQFHEVAEVVQLATPQDPFDPMEKAIHAFVDRRLQGVVRAQPGRVPAQRYELGPQLFAMTHAFALDDGSHMLAAKGAPEAIADLCHMAAPDVARVRAHVEEMAARGLRVLAVARGRWRGTAWPDSQRDLDYEFVGLVGLLDPPRPEVPAAIEACKTAGIRVIMMTGDHPATARAIALEIGLPAGAAVLTGAEIAALDDAVLRDRLKTAGICARLVPEQKFRIVRLLQSLGESVGMTGDGVNDGPALGAAEVGIAMGERGTDVAREAADIVLLDDSFASIVEAIRQGRHIEDKLRSALRFIFAVHMPIVALALVPLLFHWPVILLPPQIVLFELLIDPLCAILFDAQPPAAGLMRRRPDAAGPVFSRAVVVGGLLQGLGVAAIVVASSGAMAYFGWSGAEVRTAVFLELVAGVFMLALHPSIAGGQRVQRNPLASRFAIAMALVLAVLLSVPWLRSATGFTALSLQMAYAIGPSCAAILLWLQLFAWRSGVAGR